jgi:hypothetical protein
MSISVSRSFRKRSIPRAAARTRSDLSRRVFSLAKEAWRTSRREIPLGLAAPDHTYGTVLSKDAFPGTSCQATIGVSLRDALATASRRELASNFVTPCEGQKTSQTAFDLAPIRPIPNLMQAAESILDFLLPRPRSNARASIALDFQLIDRRSSAEWSENDEGPWNFWLQRTDADGTEFGLNIFLFFRIGG